MDQVTVPDAARILGIKEESVRKRVSRGTLRADKDPEGRLLVYVDTPETVRDEYTDTPVTESDLLYQQMQSRIDYLEAQVEAEREARRRADTIIAQLSQANAALVARVPELEAPQTSQSQDASQDAAEVDVGANPTNADPGAQEGVRRPWWRRIFG